MNKIILCIITLSIVLCFASEASTGPSQRNAEQGSFKYHKTVYILGVNQELFNYPLKIKIGKDAISKGNIEPDFRDIRFTAADGQTPLAFYLESISSNDTAYFWVKIPQLPKEGVMIYLYYGNKKAVAASNPEAVFSFFDDFNTSSLNREKWQDRFELESQPILQEGILRLRDSSIISRKFKIKEGILEFKARAEKNTAIEGIVRGSAAGSPFSIKETVYSSAFPGAEHTIAINDIAKLNIAIPIEPMTDYIYKVSVNTEGITFARYDKNYEKQAEIRFLDPYKLENGYVGLGSTSALFSEGSAYFDWVRVRSYVEPEPRVVIKN